MKLMGVRWRAGRKAVEDDRLVLVTSEDVKELMMPIPAEQFVRAMVEMSLAHGCEKIEWMEPEVVE